MVSYCLPSLSNRTETFSASLSITNCPFCVSMIKKIPARNNAAKPAVKTSQRQRPIPPREFVMFGFAGNRGLSPSACGGFALSFVLVSTASFVRSLPPANASSFSATCAALAGRRLGSRCSRRAMKLARSLGTSSRSVSTRGESCEASSFSLDRGDRSGAAANGGRPASNRNSVAPSE